LATREQREREREREREKRIFFITLQTKCTIFDDLVIRKKEREREKRDNLLYQNSIKTIFDDLVMRKHGVPLLMLVHQMAQYHMWLWHLPQS
jgi:hypothetical protein